MKTESSREWEDENFMKNKALNTDWTVRSGNLILDLTRLLNVQNPVEDPPLTVFNYFFMLMYLFPSSRASTEVLIQNSRPCFCFYFLLSVFVPL